MRALARTLVLSGHGMTICGGSYPASQGEHLISHYLDMFAPAGRAPALHGEQVAVATLTMARLQDEMLAAGPPNLFPSDMGHAELRRRFGAETGNSCWREFEGKCLSGEDAAKKLSRRLASVWDTIVREIRAVTIPAARLAAILARAGAPSTPADIGVTPELYTEAVRNARFLRNRYTFLDLADDAGMLARPWPAGAVGAYR
jgi:glycerol-1-phosphate dehydrogenase [NAD(P)+]